MATLDEMLKAGYTPQKSTVQQISDVAAGAQDYAQKQTTEQSTNLQNQTKLYFDLRQQGYSKDDATARVNRSFQSTNFIQNLMTGNGNAFQAPVNPDQVEMEQAKARAESTAKSADAQAKIAEAKKFTAQANYYDKGGPAQRYAHNDNLTPNQIQGRIKELRGQMGMGTPEEDSDIQNEIGYMNDLFNKKSGFQKGGGAGKTAGKYKPGQQVYYKGKPVTIKSVNDDGTYEI